MRNPIDRVRAVGLVSLVTGVIAIAVGVTGCGDDQRSPESRPTGTSTTSVAEITKEATEFGGVVIPDNVTVLAAHTDSALDTRYQLALRTDQQGLTQLLTASNFAAPLTKTFAVTERTIAGPPLETSPSLLETGDRIQRPGGKYVSRSVTVDERDATTRYVHIQLFTT